MVSSKTFIYSIESTEELVKTIVFLYPKSTRWAFYGPMGSGKTTLIKMFAKALGSIDEGSSPTFAIANVYKTKSFNLIYHLDLFRLKSLEEAFNAGVNEIIQTSQSYCFVEWPELIETWLDAHWMKVEILRLDENTRLIKVLS
ncbi:MAG: tRNA (adenosine(37)-N6)-threonylcarbamoyltransferase complex ATPase subunit type 1 TsaE [Saprospiraceae bacterium]